MKDKMMDDDVENIGIMQGFLDQVGEEEDELEEEEDSDEYKSARMLNRRPDSPEILMNNLRGDMRSVDARREELADLVGYDAAAETPDAVLAMLQPVLAQQAGIGALPQSGPMAQGPQPPMPPPPGGAMGGPPPGAPPLPPGGAPPPGGPDMAALLAAGGPPPGGGMAPPAGPPPGLPPELMIGPDGQPIPPEGMPPIQMKDGGLVQRFKDGSDEEGVTLDEEENSPSGMDVTPDMLALARAGYSRLLTQQPAPEVDLRARTAEREKLYSELLGDDKEMRQAQLLFALAQKGLQFAGNVDAQGRPLRGSPASRFAAVVADLPGTINQFISDADKRQNAIRMAAIQSAEKESEQTRAGNLRLIESQRKAFGDILKSAGRAPSSMFGKGSWDWSVVNTPGLLQAYADGETTPEEDNLIQSAASRLLRERTEYSTNELGQVVPRVVPGYDLPFLRDALAQRQALDAAGPRQAPTTPGTVPVGPRTVAPDMATETPVAEAPTAADQPVSEGVTAGERQFAEPTLWGAAQQGIGFIPKVTSELARRVPLEIAGELGRTQQQAASTVSKLAPRVALALRETTRLSNAEREDINMYLNIDPKLFENRIGYLNNLVSLGQVLYRIRNEALDKSSDRTLAVKDANEQRLKARDIQGVIDLVGIPPVVSTREEYIKLPIGAQFLVYNREKQAWVPDTRKPLPDEQ